MFSIATINRQSKMLFLMSVLLFLSSCASLNEDPYESFNRASFNFTETIDQEIVLPVARGYRTALPPMVRTGVSNFFDNLFYPNTAINSLLQGKVGAGVSDIGRIVVNSTLGIGGILDVASEVNLEKHNEDFGQTLAVWGSARGAYIYLPLIGPYTARYTPDLLIKSALNPLFYAHASAAIPLVLLNFVNRRADLIQQTDARDSSAIDSYIFTREAFLQQRDFLIYDGSPPLDDLDDLFDL